MKIFRKLLFALFGGMVLAAIVSCAQKPDNQEVIYSEGIETGISQIMHELDVVGLGVAVVEGDSIIYHNSWGYKNLETKTPLAEDDLFRIASISKSFTATAIMRLVEQGKLDLNADISDLVGFTVRNPNFPEVKITPYMLLSHTSSLNDSQGYFRLDVINPAVNQDFAKAYNDYRPGSKYEYCNLGYNTMGTILERTSGVRFDQYIKNQILKPLGLGYAGYQVDSLDNSKFVTLYQRDSLGAWEAQPEAYAPRREEIASYQFGYSTPIFSPTGGMKINPVGLTKVMQMHIGLGSTPEGIRIIAPQSALLMQSGLTETDDEGSNTYYGFALENTPNLIKGKTMIGHTGGAYGVYTSMFWDKERTFGIVIMTNGCNGDRENGFMAIHHRVANCLYQNLIQ